jgi:lipoprotein signal peptidase
LTSFAAHLRFWGLAVVGLVLDLWSKDWAFETLRQGGRRVLIPKLLEFQTMMNDGALFGIGGGQTTLFLLASGVALVLVFVMFAQSPARSWVLQTALAAILAGALGNMYDRLYVRLVSWRDARGIERWYVKSDSPEGGAVRLVEYPAAPGDGGILLPPGVVEGLPREVGYVRDFIKIPTKIIGDRDLWPWVFNVADMLLVGGVGVLALRLWREPSARTQDKKERVDAGAANS